MEALVCFAPFSQSPSPLVVFEKNQPGGLPRFKQKINLSGYLYYADEKEDLDTPGAFDCFVDHLFFGAGPCESTVFVTEAGVAFHFNGIDVQNEPSAE